MNRGDQPVGTAHRQRRRAVRTPVEWSSRVRPEQSDEEGVHPAIVKVFSMTGLYFETTAALEAGQKLECCIDLPADMAFGKGVVMHCLGQIVNVRAARGQAQGIGVGMRTDYMSFLEATADPFYGAGPALA